LNKLTGISPNHRVLVKSVFLSDGDKGGLHGDTRQMGMKDFLGNHKISGTSKIDDFRCH